MKVLVVNNMAPFVWGGAEELAHHLVKHLHAAGEQADVLRIPFRWNPAERLLDEMLLCKNSRLTNVDLVIGLKFPAYLIPHPNKILWLVHQYRQAYDLWDAGQSNIPDTTRGQEIRAAIKAADNACFSSCNRLFTIHTTTAERLRRYNGFESEVLMPPLNDPELFAGGEPGSYVVAGGRINSAKRQHLVVEAMRYVKSDIRLIVAGPPDTPEDAERLRRMVAENDLESRVTLDLRFLERSELASLVNQALAVAYLPFDEDYIGYVTIEAAHAAKPVITALDAGGVLDLVKDGDTGHVVPPEPEQLANAIEALAASPPTAVEMGLRAKEAWLARGVTWPQTVERLLS